MVVALEPFSGMPVAVPCGQRVWPERHHFASILHSATSKAFNLRSLNIASSKCFRRDSSAFAGACAAGAATIAFHPLDTVKTVLQNKTSICRMLCQLRTKHVCSCHHATAWDITDAVAGLQLAASRPCVASLDPYRSTND
eukprot:1567040-Amphidinium_carterae.1